MLFTVRRRQFLMYVGMGALLGLPDVSVQAQRIELDLKALFQQRLNELSKLGEQLLKGKAADATSITKPLQDLQKAFETGKAQDVINQINAFSTLLRIFNTFGFFSDLEEMILRSSFYRLVEVYTLFAEKVDKKPIKVCVARYVGGEKGDREEILAPLLNDCPKSLNITNPNGTKETFALKDCKCM